MWASRRSRPHPRTSSSGPRPRTLTLAGPTSSVRVVDVLTVSEGIRTHQLYTIEVAISDGSSVRVSRRFRDFVDLHSDLGEDFCDVACPSKSVFRRLLFKRFLVERQEELETFMRAVVFRDPMLKVTVIRQFLGLQPHIDMQEPSLMVQSIRKPLSSWKMKQRYRVKVFFPRRRPLTTLRTLRQFEELHNAIHNMFYTVAFPDTRTKRGDKTTEVQLERALEVYLSQMICLDPHLRNDALRAFLEVCSRVGTLPIQAVSITGRFRPFTLRNRYQIRIQQPSGESYMVEKSYNSFRELQRVMEYGPRQALPRTPRWMIMPYRSRLRSLGALLRCASKLDPNLEDPAVLAFVTRNVRQNSFGDGGRSFGVSAILVDCSHEDHNDDTHLAMESVTTFSDLLSSVVDDTFYKDRGLC